MAQLEAATLAVFRSWRSPKAATYRKSQGLDDAVGTAVTIQRIVFGNAGGMSGAGVGFTRDPSTGENALYMDFLFNAQGEDVVSGPPCVRLVGLMARLLLHHERLELALQRIELDGHTLTHAAGKILGKAVAFDRNQRSSSADCALS